jgi:hypothetical protein
MKLRFRANSLRLRVNQKEVEALAAGDVLTEGIQFPGGTTLSYVLTTQAATEPRAHFANGSIQIAAPQALIVAWAASDDIGLYFSLLTGADPLKIAIEKDLECMDGPVEEKDPDAFPRAVGSVC